MVLKLDFAKVFDSVSWKYFGQSHVIYELWKEMMFMDQSLFDIC